MMPGVTPVRPQRPQPTSIQTNGGHAGSRATGTVIGVRRVLTSRGSQVRSLLRPPTTPDLRKRWSARWSDSTARNRYSGLRQFYRWLAVLLGTCSGKTFVERRDNAIIRLFIDTGVRRAEMAGLGVDDIDVREQVAQVFGRGRRPRSVPFGVRTARALSRYLRERSRHPHAKSPSLWLGEKGKRPGDRL